MPVLKFHSHHLQEIQIHAERTYPEECCGLLIGQRRGEVKTLMEVWPMENSWNGEDAQAFSEIKQRSHIECSKHNRFSIAPKAMLQAQKDARDHNMDIIGIYHSHPDYPAIPSEFDQAIAWPQYSYVIVSVQQGKAIDLKSWSLDDNHQFGPEEMHTVSSGAN